MRKGIWLLIGTIFNVAYAQNPYAVFGHKVEILYQEHPYGFYWQLANSSPFSDTAFALYQPLERSVLYINQEHLIVDVLALNPQEIIRFMSADPLEKDYPSMGPYTFVANTPLNAIDPDGRLIIFVNGHHMTRPTFPGINSPHPAMRQLDYFLAMNIGYLGGKDHWNPAFIASAKTFFKDDRASFVDGTGSVFSRGEERFNNGYAWAKEHYQELIVDIFDEHGVQKEMVNVVSHSMGGAYSEGIVRYLEEQNITVSKVVHLSPVNLSGFEASTKPYTVQLNYEGDGIQGLKNLGERNIIKGVDVYGEATSALPWYTQFDHSHGRTKKDPAIFKAVEDLININFSKTGEGKSLIPGGGLVPVSTMVSYGKYQSTGDCWSTTFNKVIKGGQSFSLDKQNGGYQGP